MAPKTRPLIILCLLSLSSCSESLYETTTQPPTARVDGYEFIAPYFSKVSTAFVVSIVPGTKAQGSTYIPATVSISTIPIPTERAYLYLSRSALFSDTANVTIAADGLLSNSSTASAQQITNISTELGQTAGSVLGAAGEAFTARVKGLPEKVATTPTQADKDRSTCLTDVQSLITNGPYYQSVTEPVAHWTTGDYLIQPLPAPKGQTATLKLKITIPAGETWSPPPSIPHNLNSTGKTGGFVAFFPVPALTQLECVVGNDVIGLNAPANLNVYLVSYLLDPQRSYWTNPTDTFTLSEGFITGHQYTDQSPVKTVVDTITAPIRALLPSTTVSTSIQNGGGKPEQTTTTDVTAPPKGS